MKKLIALLLSSVLLVLFLVPVSAADVGTTKNASAYKRIEEVVASLNIIDDTLFQKMAGDIGFCEELLSTVLQQKVNIRYNEIK